MNLFLQQKFRLNFELENSDYHGEDEEGVGFNRLNNYDFKINWLSRYLSRTIYVNHPEVYMSDEYERCSLEPEVFVDSI
jgi:hypothetical protein